MGTASPHRGRREAGVGGHHHKAEGDRVGALGPQKVPEVAGSARDDATIPVSGGGQALHLADPQIGVRLQEGSAESAGESRPASFRS